MTRVNEESKKYRILGDIEDGDNERTTFVRFYSKDFRLL